MNESVTIDLNSGAKSILKVGFLIRAGFVLIFVIGSASAGVHIFSQSPAFAAVCFTVSLVLFLIFFKILNATFFKEQVIVTKDSISLLHKSLGNTRKHDFKLHEIDHFGFAEQEYTKHPLDNPVIDFTGLGTQERELQYVIDEGNIKIVSGAKTTRFGKNMPSWEVEELVEKIESFTGHKFATTGPVVSGEDLDTDTWPQTGAEIKTEIETELEEATSQGTFTKHSYTSEQGDLVIEQQKDVPSSGDRVYLHGKLAPSVKYNIGPKQFVFVSNGYIYAIRGFGNE